MNRDLLEKIYTLYAEELRLYLYSLCRDAAVAEDLMQDVFVKALMKCSFYTPGTKNECFSLFSRSWRRMFCISYTT